MMVLFTDLEKTEERTDLEIVGMKSSLCGILSLSCLLDIQEEIISSQLAGIRREVSLEI